MATNGDTITCPHPGCKAVYFLGQQEALMDEKLWAKQAEELLDRLEDDHTNGREHAEKIEFDL